MSTTRLGAAAAAIGIGAAVLSGCASSEPTTRLRFCCAATRLATIGGAQRGRIGGEKTSAPVAAGPEGQLF